MKTISSKKALLLSVLSMVICVSMLIGSTFAWFTDSATASVNTITSGNLDIVLEKQNIDGTWSEVSENTALNFLRKTSEGKFEEAEKILWEPGCTYQLPTLRIRNNGNLALKYQIVVSGATGDTMLLDVIKFTAKIDNEDGKEINVKDGGAVAEGKLIANGDESVIAISAHMDETAGNEYREKSVSGITINVVATQLNHESDSTGPDYDKNADYPEIQPVTSLDKLNEVLESDDINGKTIKLYDDIDAENLNLSGKNVAFDLNGKSLSAKKLEVKNSTVVFKDSSESGDGELVTNDSYGVINAVNSNVTIESGNFVSTYDKTGSSGYANVIQVCNSELTINGGYFENTNAVGSYNYIIKAPSDSKTEKTVITINGGEFVSHKDYGYIITSDSDANVEVTINGGIFKTEGRNSYLTNVTGSVVVNDCEFTAEGNNTVFNIPKDSTVTVKGGTFSVNENSYTDTSLAGLIFHRKTNGWTSVYGTLLVDPTNEVKVNQPTYSGFIAEGATQSAKGADGYYTIKK